MRYWAFPELKQNSFVVDEIYKKKKQQKPSELLNKHNRKQFNLIICSNLLDIVMFHVLHLLSQLKSC